MQYVDDDHKAKQNAKSDKMNYAFHLAIDWLAANPLNQREQHVRAVQRRNWQNVEHRQIRRDERDEEQKIGHVLLRI